MKRYERGSVRIVVYRVSKTAVLFTSWICLGLFNEVVGPTLDDLMSRVGANYEEIGRVLSSRSAGLLVGSVIGGFLHDRFPGRRDVFLASSLLIAGTCCALMPWMRLLSLLGVVFHIQGYGHGLLTTGGNPTLISLWAEKAPGPLNLLHGGFGVGASIAPLVARQFLSERAPDTNITVNVSVSSTGNSNSPEYGGGNSSQIVPGLQSDAVSKIEYPYMLFGFICVSVSLMFTFYACRKIPKIFRVQTNTNTKAIMNPASCAGGNRAFGIQMLVMVFLYYMLLIAGERAYAKFLFTFATKGPCQLSKSEAALLNTIYFMCFTLGRLSCLFIAQCVPVHILLFTVVSGTLLSTIGLNIWYSSRLALWVFTCSFGIFKSPLFPTGLGWVNRYLEVTSMAIMLINIGCACGGMLVQWLLGYLFQYHGPITFLYLILINTTLILLTLVVMHCVAHRHGDRFQNSEQKVDEVEVDNLPDEKKEALTNGCEVDIEYDNAKL